MLIFALGAGVSQCVLSAFVLVRRGRLSTQKYLFIGLMVAVVGYLLHPLLSNPAASVATSLMQTAVPGLFWLLTSSLFMDDFRFVSWRLGLVLITVLFPLPAQIFQPAGAVIEMMTASAQILEFVLLFLALWAVALNWQTDLVEARRDLRVWFCGLVGAYLLVLLTAREVFFSDAGWLSSAEYLCAAVFLILINLLLLQPANALWNFQPSVNAMSRNSGQGDQAEPEAELDRALVEKVQRLLTQERVYQQMGLTIGQLAVQLRVPEYKLRKAINSGLGYRNFNDFLNSYRVLEAAEHLSAESDSDTPILNIALDVGFRSLSSFNKAFKDYFKKTPTEYRKSN